MSIPDPTFDASGWRKAAASGANANCVEVNTTGRDTVGLRDTKLGEASPVIEHTAAEWTAWTTAPAEGRVTGTSAMNVAEDDLGGWNITTPTGTHLRFNAGEVAAFLDGVRRREFAR